MKKLSIVGIIIMAFSGICFLLSGISYQIYQEDIQKYKTTPVKAGSSPPFITSLPDFLRSDLDVVYGLILLPIGIGMMIVSKYLK